MMKSNIFFAVSELPKGYRVSQIINMLFHFLWANWGHFSKKCMKLYEVTSFTVNP